MCLHHRRMRRAQLRPRGVERRARRQTAEKLGHPVHASLDHRRVEVMRARDDVGDDLGLLRIRHRRLEHADDRRRPIAQPHLPADHVRIALEGARPEPVGQHRRAVGLRPVVGRSEQPAHHRPQAHHFEVRAADHARADGPRIAEADHRELDRREIAERAERLHRRPAGLSAPAPRNSRSPSRCPARSDGCR